jgi:hypothetical protein
MSMTFAVKMAEEIFMVRIFKTKYATGNTAIQLFDAQTSEQFAVLSVNTDVVLPEGHFYLKHWSENAPVVLALKPVLTECGEHAPQQLGYVVSRCYTLGDRYEV